jgi:vitamin B12 transporter
LGTRIWEFNTFQRCTACLLVTGCSLTIMLEAAAAEATSPVLPDTVVTASFVPTAAESVGSAVTVISAEQIAKSQARIVSDVLRKVPGLAVSRSGTVGSFTQVRIRGAEANHTLVIIDGIEVNDPSGGSEFDFGSLRTADIERIEVLRGPQSALYGSDAIGGVISIFTKRGKGPATGHLDLEGGSFRTGQISTGLRGGGDGFHYSVGASGYTTDGVSVAPESEGNREADGNDNGTVNIKFGVSPADNLDADFFGRYVNSTTEADSQPAVAGVIRTVDSDAETRVIQRSAGARLTYTMFDGGWEHIAGASAHEELADTTLNGATTFEADGEKIRFHYQSNILFDTPAIADAEHGLTFLAERENDAQFTVSAFGDTDRDITNLGYVGEYRVGLWERFYLTVAGRYDDNDTFKNASTYRMTAAYQQHDSGRRLHGSYGTGVKNPSLFELFGASANFIGNPNLSPESSTGWDAGVEQRLLADRLIIDLTYFNNRITDLIQGSGNTSRNLPGTSKIQGMEVTLDAEITHGLTLAGQYTYTDTKDANGSELVRRARHLASANVNYAFLDERANLNLAVDYNGEQRDSQFSNFFATRSTVTLDEFVLVNIAGSYKLTDIIQLTARVENLLDEDYQEVLGFDAPGIGGYLGLRSTFRLR